MPYYVRVALFKLNLFGRKVVTLVEWRDSNKTTEQTLLPHHRYTLLSHTVRSHTKRYDAVIYQSNDSPCLHCVHHLQFRSNTSSWLCSFGTTLKSSPSWRTADCETVHTLSFGSFPQIIPEMSDFFFLFFSRFQLES